MGQKTLKKALFKPTLFFIFVAWVVFFLIVIAFLSFNLSGNTYSSFYPTPAPIVSGLPVRLLIPKINVDASIEYLGVTSAGTMEVPTVPYDVAWFDLGPKPGEIGSAVIAGHYGTWKNGNGSVFDDLNKLRTGDEIYVEDENGLSTTFLVRELARYNPDSNSLSIFTSDDGKSHLNLITCEGIWDNVSKTYSQRLVVFTDKRID
jgi:LPXTG-site transpeptidase (sortase) family protein